MMDNKMLNDEKNSFGLDLVKKLKPILFRWAFPLNDGLQHFGFKAQDINEIFPKEDYGIVGIHKGFLTVQYNQLIPILTKAIQQLNEINISQGNEIAELKNKMRNLEEKK